jgi:hypothetical protein
MEKNVKAIDRMQAKHIDTLNAVAKTRDKRDQAIQTLIKAELRHREEVKAVSRSQKRMDKAREEEREAKAARKQAKAQSERELPDIAAVLGV